MEDIMQEMDRIEQKSKILKVLSHPIRLCIVKGLMQREGYNVSEMQSCLNIPQSTLSQHLSKLKDLSIIKGKRDGVEVHYYVINKDAINIVETLFTSK